MNRLIKNAIFGAIGGVAGTAVIGRAMGILSKLQAEKDKARERQLISENPTEKVARVVVEDGLGIRLEPEEKSVLGQAVRWGYGIGWGAAYESYAANILQLRRRDDFLSVSACHYCGRMSFYSCSV